MPECEALSSDVEQTSRLLHDAIRRSRFKGADGKPFRFTASGDRPGMYRVLNYRLNSELTNTTGFHQVPETILWYLLCKYCRVKARSH